MVTVDDIGVLTGNGNILLDARGAGHDLTVDANAVVQSTGSGNINLVADDLVDISGSVSSNSGSVYTVSTNGNITVPGQINSGAGDILLRTGQTITLAGSITSTTGDVGLIANDMSQSGSISTGGNVFVDLNNNLNMTVTGQSQAGGQLVVIGNNLTLGLLQGNIVSLLATQNILDGNDDPLPAAVLRTNIRASELQMRAGGTIGQRM